MSKITKIEAKEVFDSRGDPTVEVEATLDSGESVKMDVPSGVSTGTHEAYELRDNDPSYHNGRGVYKAIENVNKIIAPQIVGMEPIGQKVIDDVMLKLDGTKNKSRLGSNAILAVSFAVARLGAKVNNLPLYRYIQNLSGSVRVQIPCPMFVMLNGAQHAKNQLSFQEFMVVPDHLPTIGEKLKFGQAFFEQLGGYLAAHHLDISPGEEGAYSPELNDNEEAIKILHLLNPVHLALDLAGQGPSNSDFYDLLGQNYNVISFEDPLAENDWDRWAQLTKAIGRKFLLVGDDLFVTNPDRLKQGIQLGVANAVIIKPNQIGTLSEVINVVKMAKDNGYIGIVAHRAGETTDDFIADLSVGIDSAFIKAGAPNPTAPERMAKYNRLLEIEKEINQ